MHILWKNLNAGSWRDTWAAPASGRTSLLRCTCCILVKERGFTETRTTKKWKMKTKLILYPSKWWMCKCSIKDFSICSFKKDHLWKRRGGWLKFPSVFLEVLDTALGIRTTALVFLCLLLTDRWLVNSGIGTIQPIWLIYLRSMLMPNCVSLWRFYIVEIQ